MGIDPVTATLMIVSAAGTAGSIVQNSRAAKQNKEAGKIDRASQQVEAARQRRTAARQARIQRARLMQSSVNTGVGGSSGQLGAQGVISNQLASDQGYLFGSQVTADALSSRYQRAADYQMRAGISAAIGNMALTGADAFSRAQAKAGPNPVTNQV